MGMTRFSSKWILSHSTWYKFRRSGQVVVASWYGLSASPYRIPLIVDGVSPELTVLHLQKKSYSI
jgi:hypothetical protein